MTDRQTAGYIKSIQEQGRERRVKRKRPPEEPQPKGPNRKLGKITTTLTMTMVTEIDTDTYGDRPFEEILEEFKSMDEGTTIECVLGDENPGVRIEVVGEEKKDE